MNRFGMIIAEYRKKVHMSQSELADRLREVGVETSQKSVSAWETGKSMMPALTFLYVCRILQIPDFVAEYFGSNPSNPLSKLNSEGKQKVLSYIDMLVHPVSYAQEETGENVVPFVPAAASGRMRRIRLYDVSVSAGSGDFLDSDCYTVVEVPEDKAKRADFAVNVSGDSMEPLFHDHDMVFVHRQEELEDGEIGIFSLNDMAYIKKWKDSKDGTFLISLNPKYQPIPVHPEQDSFCIFGKVCR